MAPVVQIHRQHPVTQQFSNKTETTEKSRSSENHAFSDRFPAENHVTKRPDHLMESQKRPARALREGYVAYICKENMPIFRHFKTTEIERGYPRFLIIRQPRQRHFPPPSDPGRPPGVTTEPLSHDNGALLAMQRWPRCNARRALRQRGNTDVFQQNSTTLRQSTT